MVDWDRLERGLKEEQIEESRGPASIDFAEIFKKRKVSRQLKIEELRSSSSASENKSFKMVKMVFIFLGVVNVLLLLVLGGFLFFGSGFK